ncbi:MAG: SIS domain-containing protein [Chloroflexi bacterium]|nr:SIS domain-containing protein [Chloroflexota bacterium]
MTEPLPGAPDPWTPSEMPAFRARPPYRMSEMIGAEPALGERLVRRLSADVALDALATVIRETVAAGQPILTTGCGTSEHAAMAVAALLNEALDLPAGRDVRAVQALESLRRPMRDGLLIAVSHEGGTHATNEAIRAARDGGARTALITVGSESPGAALAELTVCTEEQDQSWCHTVGYLSPILSGVVIAARLAGTRPDARAIHALLDVANEPRSAADVAAGLSEIDRLIVIGSGVDYVTARELALKVAEGARLAAEAHELETILHGHLAAATRWTGMLVVLSGGPAPVMDRARKVFAAARALGMPAAAILSEPLDAEIPADHTPAGRILLPQIGRVPGLAGRLLASAIALQLLAERLARARGVNPDTLGREDPAQAAAHA